MMFLALSTLVSISAFAQAPAVGDMAKYDVMANGFVGTQKVELTGYDANTDLYEQTTSVESNGQTNISVESVAGSDLQDRSQLEMIIAMCGLAGGTVEDVTVAAGTFTTCKLAGEMGGTFHLGVVPFAIVKLTTVDLSMELIDFNFAN